MELLPSKEPWLLPFSAFIIHSESVWSWIEEALPSDQHNKIKLNLSVVEMRLRVYLNIKSHKMTIKAQFRLCHKMTIWIYYVKDYYYMVCLKVYYHIKLDLCTTVTACIWNIKWGASSRWSFRPNSVWGRIETMTIAKTPPTLLTDMDPRLQIVPNPSFYIVRDIQQSDLVQHSELSAVQDLHIDHQWSRANLL